MAENLPIFLEEENIFTDKEEITDEEKNANISTQTFEEKAVQPRNVFTMNNPSTTLTISLAMLVNRFLHSSYWFLSLSLVFSLHNLSNLRSNSSFRQSITRSCAKRILSLLMPMDSNLLVDVAKPSLRITECTVNQAVGNIRDLDRWLLDSLLEVVGRAKDESLFSIVEVLEQMVEEQMILVEESEEMNSRSFIYYDFK